MEMKCDHHFKHPPCLGQDANGRSVTAASGVYTRAMLYCLVGCIAMLVGAKEKLTSISDSLSTDAIVHETFNVDHSFANATTATYLRDVCIPLDHFTKTSVSPSLARGVRTCVVPDSATRPPERCKLGGGVLTSVDWRRWC